MTIFPAILALTLPEHPTLAENLQYQLTGFLVVLFSLGAVALIVGLIGRIFTTLAERGAAAPGTAESDISPAVLAAIAGAVAATLGDRRFTMHGVRVADPGTNLAWSTEGRRSIYASHQIR